MPGNRILHFRTLFLSSLWETYSESGVARASARAFLAKGVGLPSSESICFITATSCLSSFRSFCKCSTIASVISLVSFLSYLNLSAKNGWRCLLPSRSYLNKQALFPFRQQCHFF